MLLRRLLFCPVFLFAAWSHAGAEDSRLWRVMHGPLLAATRAGHRLLLTGDRGTVLLSDDQGLHWRLVETGVSVLLTAAVFPNPADGFAVGQDSTILHTSDAGAHWVLQLSKPGGDQSLFSVTSLGPHHLMATGAYALALESVDGVAWSPVTLPPMDEDYHLNCVAARGDDVVISGEAGHGFIRHDGKWAVNNVPYEGSQFGCLTAKSGDIYSFGLRGSLFVSSIAQPGWKRIETGEQRSIFGGAWLDDGRMALVGGNGLLMLLDPASGHIQTLPNPTSSTLSGVVQATHDTLVVVGSDGVHSATLPQSTPPAGGLTQ